MEFLNGILRFLGKNSSVSSDSSFNLVFYPHFSVLQNAIHEKTLVFLFSGFFLQGPLKPEKSTFFFKIRQ
jgi:hypothetical protein